MPRGKARIGPTRLKSAPIRRKSAPTRPKSGRLGPYRPYRPKRPSQAEIKKKKKVQTHRFTNLKTPDPSHFVQPLSLCPSSLCVTHCSYENLKKHPSCALSLILVIYLLYVSGSLCECSVLLHFSLQVCSLYSFLEFFFLCFLQFLSFKLLIKIFVNLKIYVLDYWLLVLFLVSGSLCFGLFV